MGRVYVCNGAQMFCSKGTSTANLTVLPDRKILLDGQPMANIMDFKPGTNIPSFGLCTSLSNPVVKAATDANLGVLTPMPCIPNTIAPWQNGKNELSLKNAPALCQDCKLSCKWAGTISLVDSGQGKGQGAFPLSKDSRDDELQEHLFIKWNGVSACVGEKLPLKIKTNSKNNTNVSIRVIDADTKESLSEINVPLDNGEGIMDGIVIPAEWESLSIKVECTPKGKKIETSILKIAPLYGDPVNNPELRTDNNPFIGYYGYSRDKGEKRHTGFDYIATKGVTEALAVFSCKKMEIQVWIGKPGVDCKLRSKYINNRFDKDDKNDNFFCDSCSVLGKDKCYGVRLFLIGNGEKVCYAHLYSIHEKIYKKLSLEKYSEGDKEYEYYVVRNEEIKVGEVLGLTGKTGNAWNIETNQEHLHFEYYEGANNAIPNKIVKTQFAIVEKNKGNSSIIWEPTSDISQEEWKRFFKGIDTGVRNINNLDIEAEPRTMCMLYNN